LIASGTDTDVRTANAYETNDYLGKGNWTSKWFEIHSVGSVSIGIIHSEIIGLVDTLPEEDVQVCWSRAGETP